jgi:enamine deaminase RidA (YjgF/YER057c/UK114 family)
MAKLAATEGAQQVIDAAVQLFGGLGVVSGSRSSACTARSARCASTKAPPRCSNSSSRRELLKVVAGMIGWDAQGRFHSDDLVAQVRQALQNVVDVLAEAGATPAHITRMTWYVTDKREYLAARREIGAAYRELIGNFDVAMTAVQVVA